MFQNKEKKTAIKANLRSLCNQQSRYNLRAINRGFTLAEILLVIVIIAIAAMIAAPMMGSTNGMQIRSAANIIAADLEYAKSMAISRQNSYSVVFDPINDYYEIQDPNGIIKHPVKKGFDYRVDFSSDSRLDKVNIQNVDFDSDPGNTITFDYLGSPYSGSGTSNPLNSGEINLRAGDFNMNVNVEPVTGFISITD